LTQKSSYRLKPVTSVAIVVTNSTAATTSTTGSKHVDTMKVQ